MMTRTYIVRAAAQAAIALGLVFVGVAGRADAASGPPPVEAALAAQRALGYAPCTPKVLDLPADELAKGALGDSWNQGGICEIRLDPNLPDKDVAWVVWHEVCHLSTLDAILAAGLDVHEAPAFKQCVRLGPDDGGLYSR